jgi:hypothetical protein
MASRWLRLLLVLSALLGSGPIASRAAYAEVATVSATVPRRVVAVVVARCPAAASDRDREVAKACATRSPSPLRALARAPKSPRYLLHRALLL